MKKLTTILSLSLLFIAYSCSKSGTSSATTTPNIIVKGVTYNNPTVTKDTSLSTPQYRRLSARTTVTNPSIDITFSPLVPTSSGSKPLLNGVKINTNYNGKYYEGGKGTLSFNVTNGKITNINLSSVWQYYQNGSIRDSIQVSISDISEL
jgi:hypothetical protein